jgi:hypothetical protein
MLRVLFRGAGTGEREVRMPLPAGQVVGTCGFGYQEWRGRFYPLELPPSGWLAFYARVFDAVELPPSLAAAEGREPLARLLGGRPAGLPVVVEVRHRSWAEPWLAELLAGDGAAFANNRFEGAAFATAAALRRRLGQDSPDPRLLWPAPPLPGLAP